MNFAIVHHTSDNCIEGIAVTNNGEWSVLDLSQAAFECVDAAQEIIFRFHCYSIDVFRPLMPPAIR